MSYVRSTHREIGTQLQGKLGSLEEENAGLLDLIRQSRELEPDLTDRASTASSQDWHMIRYLRNTRLIKDIELALKAIENDSYGLCELCGEHISDRRLVAIPGVRFCVECQELMEANPEEFSRTGLGGGLLAAV